MSEAAAAVPSIRARRGSPVGDAIFAGRVNAAWNQLRTPERRRAYDAEHPAERLVSVAPASPAMAEWARASPPVPSPSQRWQRRMPLLALMVACAGLGLLALRDVARDEALVAGTIANTNGLLVILAKLVAKGVFDRADLQSFSDSYSKPLDHVGMRENELVSQMQDQMEFTLAELMRFLSERDNDD